MSTKELIAGYAAYTDAHELGTALGDQAPAVASSQVPSTLTLPPVPTTTVPSVTFTPPLSIA